MIKASEAKKKALKLDEENKRKSHYYNEILSKEIEKVAIEGKFNYVLNLPIPTIAKDSTLEELDGFIKIKQLERWLRFDGYTLSNVVGNLMISWDDSI